MESLREKVVNLLTVTDHKKYSEMYPKDAIVYFVEPAQCNIGTGKYSIRWGVVNEVMWDEVYIDFLAIKPDYKLDGKVLDKCKFPSVWKKLPKNWSEKRLFLVTNNSKPYDIPFNSEAITKAYKDGKLVKISENEIFGINFHIETEVEKERYRLKKRPISDNDYSRGYTRKKGSELFLSYDDAVKEKERLEAARAVKIDDEALVIDDIKNTINRWVKCCSIPEYIANRVLDYLLNKNVENIDVRLFGGYIQWIDLRKTSGWKNAYTVIV